MGGGDCILSKFGVQLQTAVIYHHIKWWFLVTHYTLCGYGCYFQLLLRWASIFLRLFWVSVKFLVIIIIIKTWRVFGNYHMRIEIARIIEGFCCPIFELSFPVEFSISIKFWITSEFRFLRVCVSLNLKLNPSFTKLILGFCSSCP